MNYSTFKKAFACTMIAALGVAGAAEAQEPAKVFGGRSQYRTWSLGINGGVTIPAVVSGNSSSFKGGNTNIFDYTPREYYGISLRKQFSHLFSLQGNLNRGRIFAFSDEDTQTTGVPSRDGSQNFHSAETSVELAGSISGVFQLLTIDFLRRENAVNFYASLGYGLAAYDPTNYTDRDGNTGAYNVSGTYGPDGDRDYILEAFIPVGVGVKFRLSDRVALDLGHTMNYTRGNNLYGQVQNNNGKDKFSYTYAGLEFSLGSRNKENLTWSNPVANLYDELKDPTLRNEVEALKQRVSTLESTVDELSRDSDGDGVSDKFDKCPNTPAGTQVDGSGCPIKFPEPEVQQSVGVYPNIQFEFDSSVLKTESYSTLDKLSSDLRATGATVHLDGHASAEGSEAYNLQLSKDRANSVKNYLVNSGVDANKVVVTGYGESAPIASNATEAGRIQNRRVEIKAN